MANALVLLSGVLLLCLILNRTLTIILQVLSHLQLFHFPACNRKATVVRWKHEVLYFHSQRCNSYENIEWQSRYTHFCFFFRFHAPSTERSGPFIHRNTEFSSYFSFLTRTWPYTGYLREWKGGLSQRVLIWGFMDPFGSLVKPKNPFSE